LAWLLHRDAEGQPPNSLDDADVAAALQRIASPAIAVSAAIATPPTQRLIFAPPEATPAAAIARRQFDRDWWVYSFSQLARADDGAEASGARDEIEPVPDALAARFVGARFGNALHTALEAVDFASWREWSLDLPPTGEYEHIAGALRGQGFASEAEQLEGLPLLTRLIAATLNARMPEGAVLARLPRESRCPELEFHLAFDPIAVPALIELLHAYGIVRDRQGFGLRQRIEGLLVGFIDLVYEHAGRYYVLDYKSNRLPDYAPAALALSVRDNEYDLQYTLYSLALHRWLRFRLGAAYDYDAHMGGVRYLYCRGLVDREGIHALTLPRALIETLDAFMAPPKPPERIA
jgi:exodeoxyribonuclease V beta subunit